MAQIFPQWTNKLPLVTIAGAGLIAVLAVGFFWYYGSPKFTDVGYRPQQPVKYSHKLHAGDLGIDCRYCHNFVEVSATANVPPTQTCMNCHKLIGTDNEKLLPVRESWSTGRPIEWVRVHMLPNYAYFDHAAHLRAGVGCASCHGRVDNMEVVQQAKPLSMSWCLECHRDPDQHLRPHSELTNMGWTPPADQAEFAKRVKAEKQINPPVDCSGCHR
ncbi:MAG: cytochrome c3 family protein [bacterium]